MPRDMIASILRFLPFVDVLTCRLVTSSWASEEVAHIASDNNPEFDLQRKLRSLEFWLTYSRLFGKGIKQFAISLLSYEASSLPSILDACPNVKSIFVEDNFYEEEELQTLTRYTNVEEIVFDDVFETEDDMIGFLRNAPHLTSLSYFCRYSDRSPLSSAAMLRTAPNLQSLTISFAKEGAIADAPHRLRKLDITVDLTDENLQEITFYLHNIEEFHCYSLRDVSPPALLEFVRSTPTLKVLRSEELDDPDGHRRNMWWDEDIGRWLQSYCDIWKEAQEILSKRD